MTAYSDIALTPAIIDLQEQKGSRTLFGDTTSQGQGEPHHLESMEIEMLTTRDSFYLASVSETRWPYVQHRGGERGFIKVLDEYTIGWTERYGNRQYLGTGNISANGRVAAILMDYPSRSRLKLFGTATYHPEPSPELLAKLDGEGSRNDGAITVEVLATDWNCPKHITPRFTEEQIDARTRSLQARIVELEHELAETIAGRNGCS